MRWRTRPARRDEPLFLLLRRERRQYLVFIPTWRKAVYNTSIQPVLGSFSASAKLRYKTVGCWLGWLGWLGWLAGWLAGCRHLSSSYHMPLLERGEYTAWKLPCNICMGIGQTNIANSQHQRISTTSYLMLSKKMRFPHSIEQSHCFNIDMNWQQQDIHQNGGIPHG